MLINILGMSEEQMEKFLIIYASSFTRMMLETSKNFLIQLESVSDMARNLNLSINVIQEYIIDKQAVLDSLNNEFSLFKKHIEEEKSEFIRT